MSNDMYETNTKMSTPLPCDLGGNEDDYIPFHVFSLLFQQYHNTSIHPNLHLQYETVENTDYPPTPALVFIRTITPANEKSIGTVRYEVRRHQTWGLILLFSLPNHPSPFDSDTIYSLVPKDKRDMVQTSGVGGGTSITLTEEYGRPGYWMIHPCGMLDVFKEFNNSMSVITTPSLLQYISLLGRYVGLEIPLEIAKGIMDEFGVNTQVFVDDHNDPSGPGPSGGNGGGPSNEPAFPSQNYQSSGHSDPASFYDGGSFPGTSGEQTSSSYRSIPSSLPIPEVPDLVVMNSHGNNPLASCTQPTLHQDAYIRQQMMPQPISRQLQNNHSNPMSDQIFDYRRGNHGGPTTVKIKQKPDYTGYRDQNARLKASREAMEAAQKFVIRQSETSLATSHTYLPQHSFSAPSPQTLDHWHLATPTFMMTPSSSMDSHQTSSLRGPSTPISPLDNASCPIYGETIEPMSRGLFKSRFSPSLPERNNQFFASLTEGPGTTDQFGAFLYPGVVHHNFIPNGRNPSYNNAPFQDSTNSYLGPFPSPDFQTLNMFQTLPASQLIPNSGEAWDSPPAPTKFNGWEAQHFPSTVTHDLALIPKNNIYNKPSRQKNKRKSSLTQRRGSRGQKFNVLPDTQLTRPITGMTSNGAKHQRFSKKRTMSNNVVQAFSPMTANHRSGQPSLNTVNPTTPLSHVSHNIQKDMIPAQMGLNLEHAPYPIQSESSWISEHTHLSYMYAAPKPDNINSIGYSQNGTPGNYTMLSSTQNDLKPEDYGIDHSQNFTCENSVIVPNLQNRNPNASFDEDKLSTFAADVTTGVF